jgi:dihydroorotase
MNDGFVATELGLKGIPWVAESAAVARDVMLAEYTGARLHVCHISTRQSLEIIRNARKRGARITCEVTPHHFTLTEEAVRGYDTNTKMNPPLRGAEDVAAMKEGLADGTIDAIATDHAPHAAYEKAVEFELAPFGVIGLETALALAITRLHRERRLPLARIVELLSANPARIMKLKGRGTLARGSVADVTIFDPARRWTYDVSKSLSKSRNSPFDGWQLWGKVVATIVGGKVVFQA